MKVRALAAAGFLAASLALATSAQAAIITYDFTGVGYVRTYTGVGEEVTNLETTFTGSITLNIDPAGPGGMDAVVIPGTSAYDQDAWVTSTFVINWGDVSFTPTLGPDHTYQDYGTTVRLGNPYGVATQTWFSGPNGATYASFIRQSNDPWLSSLDFPEDAGLAPNGSNYIDFGDRFFVLNGDQRDWLGFYGRVSLTSLELRPIDVPEPGSLALLAGGLLGVGFLRRRRQRA